MNPPRTSRLMITPWLTAAAILAAPGAASADVLGQTTSTVAATTAPVVQAAAPVVEPVVAAVAPTAAPVVEPVQQAVAPVAQPVQEVVAPVVKPVQQVVAPVAKPVQQVVAPATKPAQQVTAPTSRPSTQTSSGVPTARADAEFVPVPAQPATSGGAQQDPIDRIEVTPEASDQGFATVPSVPAVPTAEALQTQAQTQAPVADRVAAAGLPKTGQSLLALIAWALTIMWMGTMLQAHRPLMRGSSRLIAR